MMYPQYYCWNPGCEYAWKEDKPLPKNTVKCPKCGSYKITMTMVEKRREERR